MEFKCPVCRVLQPTDMAIDLPIETCPRLCLDCAEEIEATAGALERCQADYPPGDLLEHLKARWMSECSTKEHADAMQSAIAVLQFLL